MNIFDNSLDSEDLRDYLQQRNQLQILYSQSFINNIFPVLAALWLTFILHSASNRLYLYSWLSLVLVFSMIRHILLVNYRRTEITPFNIGFWLNIYIITVVISGIIWASAGIMLIPYNPHNPVEFTLYNGLTLLTICGLVAGAVISYSVKIFVLISYSYTALLPPAFFLISIGDRHNSTFGGLVLLYCFFISVAAFRMNKQFRYFIEMEYEREAILYRYEKLRALYEDLKTRKLK